ncbi:hypothetical protein K505DRAFT_344395 [Melanomma pulvis-pyrius CBS 109.77]|uniref:Uncharacterized protein n=1 Tax=Melanomma pulvis-pyrius CBS 109.77 TaxID=1314802 RepID=A0A6A6WP55_9PLEO|nr:hypothetical protein K505DRAFT_344395 [Melanomma pulvis-pyrius CBS 109.77]
MLARDAEDTDCAPSRLATLPPTLSSVLCTLTLLLLRGAAPAPASPSLPRSPVHAASTWGLLRCLSVPAPPASGHFNRTRRVFATVEPLPSHAPATQTRHCSITSSSFERASRTAEWDRSC